jgi:hypothetical protein
LVVAIKAGVDRIKEDRGMNLNGIPLGLNKDGSTPIAAAKIQGDI